MEDRPISKRQLRRIQTLWGILYKHTGEAGEQGDSRKLRLAWIGLKIGRQIESCNQLTGAEAKAAIDAIQKLLPAELVRKPKADPATGTAGRAGRTRSGEVRLPDGETLATLQSLTAQLGMDRARLDAFLHSPKSPVRGAIRTLADANKVIWSLKSMLRRRNRATNGSDGRDSGAPSGRVGVDDRTNV